uniref:Cytochrome P450, family 46, subfamily A, polypeptide 1 n=1 Tax=Nothobranchius korthausae TaxID=1143690 RepID=A0A1A8FS75_9TELE
MKNDGLIHDKLLEWAETYGPVYRLNVLHYVFLCVTCPEATKEILMSSKYPKDEFVYTRLQTLFGQRLFGNGLVTTRDHNQWYKQRRIMDPAFSSLYLRGLIGTFNDRAEKLMDKLGDAADNETEAFMLKLFNCVTLDVIAKVAFGQETTANQLAFCVMELARHPEILEKVRTEVDDVIGMKQDIGYEDLGKLSYLSQVLKETLRLYSTSPGISRQIEEDMVIDGIHIPGGVPCMFSSYAVGRMERFFKDPLKFDPDRFHPDAPKPYYCYYPFALGPRSCLGQNFAQMESKVVMAKLIQRFEFSLVPGQTFDIEDTGMLRPKSGVVCSIRHRK